MRKIEVPFNLDLLQLDDAAVRGIRPVTVTDIFDSTRSGLHPDGLYSTEIFGSVGDESRMARFSYINIKAEILHPIIYKSLIDARALYLQIMQGKQYAIFNEEKKDFDVASPLDGFTGFHYFMQHWKKIHLEDATSPRRQETNRLLKKYKDLSTLTRVVVMPAGLRDVEFKGGRPQVDEINEFYRRILQISNSITEANMVHSPELMDNPRFMIQRTMYDLYEHLSKMVQGKRKLMMGGWASRGIVNGTRNVITSASISTDDADDPLSPGIDTTFVGLYQQMKAALPKAQRGLMTGFLTKVFKGADLPAVLVNKRTMLAEEVMLKPAYFDRYMSEEGLEKVISSFSNLGLRHKPIEIEGRYLGLVYLGPDGTVRPLQGIDELPEERSKEHVRPMTLYDLLYLSTFKLIHMLPGLLTRYPVTGTGSTYASFGYVRTTVKTERRTLLDDYWVPDPETVFVEYPIPGLKSHDSLSPNPSRLKGLGADFDGDTCSWEVLYSDTVIREITNYLNSKRAWVDTSNRFVASIATDTVEYVLYNMTGA